MALSKSQLIDLYRLMVVGRKIEQVICDNKANWHPALGEEATIVGTFYGLRADDVVAPHFRGAVIASYVRGGDLRRLLAGVLGKETGYSRGRYRGDIWGPPELNIIGLYSGILGPTISYAAGAALAAKLKGTDSVAVVSFGEGTSNRGDFHEGINLAAVLGLPVVFVCQNNQWAVSTPACKSLKCNSIADRAPGYGIPGVALDGNDAAVVHEAVQNAVARARRGDGPTLIEALTYRACGHWAADPAVYMPAEEMASWKARDPISRLKARLLEQGAATSEEVEKMDLEINGEVESAWRSAEADPEPGLDVLGLNEVYA